MAKKTAAGMYRRKTLAAAMKAAEKYHPGIPYCVVPEMGTYLAIPSEVEGRHAPRHDK